ncbi:hypothetical protein SAMN02745823_01389 [Sporobacter termitidis DSM 10068]|uniref:Uncharacterized protein n=1 Tax=Sporobacter termitidis DSM 10068 TaxID=1123282 RepID=A0A1M5WVT6_9FIRM|nr:hypothetical protein [Sporobacter termitidis]SHH91143.1 hypothetical protein SAMN02745823_01389 [Sporobacter termitidis DSM 10068]
MNDNFTKVVLAGILVCLAILAFKPAPTATATANPSIDTGEQIVQLAPDRIAVVDNRTNSGMRGTVLVYDYDSTAKTFSFAGSFDYSDYFSNPQKYGLPLN